MPQGRTTQLRVTLTPAERHTLQGWQWAVRVPAGQARRGRILLLLADGLPIAHVARTVGITRRHVYKWARRFQADGLPGLRDLPRRGPAP